jgi:hypothetical protein
VISTDSNTPQDDLAGILFSYEAHLNQRQVAVIRASERGTGIVVEWAALYARRTITFPSQAHAKQFVDEALTALEYLGCTINDWWEREPALASRAPRSLRTPAATAA